jgi:putative endonuclease
MAAHNDFGAAAEALAAELFCRGGWQILARNWRGGRREIDLVARRGDTVAFVEVRARRPGSFGGPLETVGPRKRRALEAAARVWIARHGRPRDVYRFDVVAFRTPAWRGPRRSDVEHVADAWRCRGGPAAPAGGTADRGPA